MNRTLREDEYPEIVPVGRARYRVCFAKALKNGDLGFCDGDMKLIVLSRTQSPDEMLATFYHELLHAAEFELGVKLTHREIRKA